MEFFFFAPHPRNWGSLIHLLFGPGWAYIPDWDVLWTPLVVYYYLTSESSLAILAWQQGSLMAKHEKLGSGLQSLN